MTKVWYDEPATISEKDWEILKEKHSLKMSSDAWIKISELTEDDLKNLTKDVEIGS